jgi:Fe-S-cluster containining protein
MMVGGMRPRRPPWYADGLRFECTRCGRCCTGKGYVWVSEERIREIAEFLGISVERFTRRHVRRVESRLSLVEKEHADCVFWERDRGCTIYPVRPVQCRTFPFWPEHLESPDAWRDLADEVPGVGRGRRHGESEIRRRLRRSRRSGG